MNETKFTPGLWKWDGKVWDYDHKNEAPWLVQDSDEGDPILKGEIKCTSEANAHLIAAAPDLYEALLTVVENAPEPYCAITRAIDAQCRAALAKARGE